MYNKPILDQAQQSPDQSPDVAQNVEQKIDSAPDGKIDTNQIIAEIQIPPELQKAYDAAVTAGMQIMFDKRSHQIMISTLDAEGAMDDKLSKGIMQLVDIIWGKSNGALPPDIMIPVAVTLLLKAFDFLQKSNDPNATKEVLGNSVEKLINQYKALASQQPQESQQSGQPPAQPQGPSQPSIMESVNG